MKFSSSEFVLMYKDVGVLAFNIVLKSVAVIRKDLLPLYLLSGQPTFDLLCGFFSSRALLKNRAHYKELLTACGIDDHSELSICLYSRALSFTDCYWVKERYGSETWKDVNLFDNEFSLNVASTGLTGNLYGRDRLGTGALMTKGTKAKGIFRINGEILLFKSETEDEILSECLSHHIAKELGLRSAPYWRQDMLGKDCSVCRIMCDEHNELVPCRDMMSLFNEYGMSCSAKHYEMFLKYDSYNFLLMHIFDYITLNTDRNRDNFGLLKSNGRLLGMFPLFDHNSCFKGRGLNGIYFPTGLTFSRTLEHIKKLPVYAQLQGNIVSLKSRMASDEFKSLFLSYRPAETYDAFCRRVQNL